MDHNTYGILMPIIDGKDGSAKDLFQPSQWIEGKMHNDIVSTEVKKTIGLDGVLSAPFL